VLPPLLLVDPLLPPLLEVLPPLLLVLPPLLLVDPLLPLLVLPLEAPLLPLLPPLLLLLLLPLLGPSDPPQAKVATTTARTASRERCMGGPPGGCPTAQALPRRAASARPQCVSACSLDRETALQLPCDGRARKWARVGARR
jgi:hypothetical protein